MNQRKKRKPAQQRRQAENNPVTPAGEDSGDAIRAEAGRRMSSIDAALERAAQVDARTFLEQSRQTGGQ